MTFSQWCFVLQASELATETTNYEEQEQELMMVCVEELCKCLHSCFTVWQWGTDSKLQVYLGALSVSASVNKQVVDLSEELARKVEDSLRQQEEISSLLAQIVDLQARCKGVRGAHAQVPKIRCPQGACTKLLLTLQKFM